MVTSTAKPQELKHLVVVVAVATAEAATVVVLPAVVPTVVMTAAAQIAAQNVPRAARVVAVAIATNLIR